MESNRRVEINMESRIRIDCRTKGKRKQSGALLGKQGTRENIMDIAESIGNIMEPQWKPITDTQVKNADSNGSTIICQGSRYSLCRMLISAIRYSRASRCPWSHRGARSQNTECRRRSDTRGKVAATSFCHTSRGNEISSPSENRRDVSFDGGTIGFMLRGVKACFMILIGVFESCSSKL